MTIKKKSGSSRSSFSSGEQAREERQKEADKITKKYILMAGTVGIIPAPFLDQVVIGGLLGKMVYDLGQLYGIKTTKYRNKAVILAILGGAHTDWIPQYLTFYLSMLIPGVSTMSLLVLRPVLAGAITHIIAKVFIRQFEVTLEVQLFVQYLLTFMLFIFAQRASQREAVTAVEHALQRVRIRIADKVRKSELRTIENLGDRGSYSSLTQGASTIAQSAMYLVTGIESLLVLVFASLYLLWLSPPSFVVAIVLISGAIALLVKHYQKTFLELSEAARKEGQFFEHFTSMLKGFKQLKTNQQQSDDLFSHIERVATETSHLKSRSNVRLLEDILLSNVTFYLLLLIVVFLLPTLLTESEENLFQLITTILFMMEPVSRISSALPNVSKTNVAINNLYKLEATLDAGHSSSKVKNNKVKSSTENATEITSFESFNTLHLQATGFAYVNAQQQPLFQAGPFTTSLQRGETIFITGSNSSGKSTFLKLLTGLYQPDQGFIKVDDEILYADSYPAYRELFSVVFDDFYLFDQLYGFAETPELEINDWLKKLDIYHKTRFEKGAFTHTDLSTGQRKRLAFIAAIIQHRPVLVFDELAADQEPAFRQRFYEEILPELKAQGKTIIAVTHDDRYFNTADRVLHMEAGRILY